MPQNVLTVRYWNTWRRETDYTPLKTRFKTSLIQRSYSHHLKATFLNTEYCIELRPNPKASIPYLSVYQIKVRHIRVSHDWLTVHCLNKIRVDEFVVKKLISSFDSGRILMRKKIRLAGTKRFTDNRLVLVFSPFVSLNKLS